MNVRTPEATAEILSRYKERNAQRLLESDHLVAEVRGLGDTWFLLRAIEAEGLDINDLKGRSRLLVPLIVSRGYGSKWLADGLHVEDKDSLEFKSVRVIEEKLPNFMGPEVQNVAHFLGIDEETAEFTTGAKVLAAAVIDLSSPTLLSRSQELGFQILKSYARAKTLQAVIRVRHVTEGVDRWLVDNHS